MLDFQWLLGFVGKEEETLQKPYFKMFMNMVLTTGFSTVTKPPVWLWICGDKETELMACHLTWHAIFTTNYMKKYSTYKPTKFEQLEDLSTTSKNARAPICLLFLVQKADKTKFNIPSVFHMPETLVYNKPRKYQELEYGIHTTELQMEFHLHLFKLFCCPRDTMYSVFNGMKILIAGLVSISSILFNSSFLNELPC